MDLLQRQSMQIVQHRWIDVALCGLATLPCPVCRQPKQRTVMRHLHSNESNELSKMNVNFSVFQRPGSSCYQIRRWSVVLDGHVARKCWDLDADGHPRDNTCHAKILIPTTWDKRKHFLINRHRFLCQQNRNHSMSSLPKFVLTALEDLVSISVLTVWQHFTCDDLVFQPWMATFRNDTHEDLSHFWRPPKSFDLMLHTSNTTVHLTKWCQGHLNEEETGQQTRTTTKQRQVAKHTTNHEGSQVKSSQVTVTHLHTSSPIFTPNKLSSLWLSDIPFSETICIKCCIQWIMMIILMIVTIHHSHRSNVSHITKLFIHLSSSLLTASHLQIMFPWFEPIYKLTISTSLYFDFPSHEKLRPNWCCVLMFCVYRPKPKLWNSHGRVMAERWKGHANHWQPVNEPDADVQREADEADVQGSRSRREGSVSVSNVSRTSARLSSWLQGKT